MVKFTFCPTRDFNELRVPKMNTLQLLRDGASQQLCASAEGAGVFIGMGLMLREGLLVLFAITGLSTMAQAQPKILTLACEGTIKFISSREQTPVSTAMTPDAPSYRASGTIDRVTGAVVAFVESHESQEMCSLKCKSPAQRIF
jgi:hypothetical protein